MVGTEPAVAVDGRVPGIRVGARWYDIGLVYIGKGHATPEKRAMGEAAIEEIARDLGLRPMNDGS